MLRHNPFLVQDFFSNGLVELMGLGFPGECATGKIALRSLQDAMVAGHVYVLPLKMEEVPNASKVEPLRDYEAMKERLDRAEMSHKADARRCPVIDYEPFDMVYLEPEGRLVAFLGTLDALDWERPGVVTRLRLYGSGSFLQHGWHQTREQDSMHTRDPVSASLGVLRWAYEWWARGEGAMRTHDDVKDPTEPDPAHVLEPGEKAAATATATGKWKPSRLNKRLGKACIAPWQCVHPILKDQLLVVLPNFSVYRKNASPALNWRRESLKWWLDLYEPTAVFGVYASPRAGKKKPVVGEYLDLQAVTNMYELKQRFAMLRVETDKAEYNASAKKDCRRPTSDCCIS